MSRANPRYRRVNQSLPAATGNVIRYKIICQIESQITISTFWFVDNNAPGSMTSAEQLSIDTALSAVGNLLPKFFACCSADLVGVATEIDSPNNPLLVTYQSPLVGGGTGPAGHEPTYVSATMARVTDFKGQCGRGRLAIPAVPTAWVTASSLTNLTPYNALAAQMVQNVTAGAATLVPSLYSRGSRLFKTVGAAPLNDVAIRPLLGTTRRRKVGRGK